ncbi:Trimethyllysine dioxygenase [Jackrogersella minutella]|nr:Trimethyllysine dioxygenase [Jackrogersella minutella]
MSFISGVTRCGRHMISRAAGVRHNWQCRQVHFSMLKFVNEKPSVSISSDGLEFKVSHDKRTLLPNFWLRDNCRCSSCVNQDTMQRNFNTFDIPDDIQASQITPGEDGVKVKWSGDGHESFYLWEFLEFYLRYNQRPSEYTEYKYFGAQGPKNNSKHWPPSIKYGDFAVDETKAVGRLTNFIRRNGFAFVTGVPIESATPTKTLLEKIAFIRETHYGGFYDFIPDLALADTAYTNLPLGAHTDTTYFTDPAGLQAFHLLSHTDPSSPDRNENLGGKSLLVDGFHAGAILRKEDPRAFQILNRYKLQWHASGNNGITIAPDKLYPVFELEAKTQLMHRIRWNNDDRGVVNFESEYQPTGWYQAARKWHEILTRESMEYWFQLEPGNLLIFDNWRVLHGRSAFTGVRRICGAYINRDDFISRWRNTNFPRDEVLKRVIG